MSLERAPEPKPNGPWVQSVRLAFGFLFLALGLLALGWLVSNLRTVPPDMRAAVLRFGALDRVQGSGLVLAWPKPIEEVVLLPSAERSLDLRITRLDASLRSSDAAGQSFAINTDPRANIAFFLTGDAGVVHLSAEAFYRVSEPAAYLLARDGLDGLLQRIVIASAVTVAGERDLDAILVTGPKLGAPASREQLRADLTRETNRRLRLLQAEGQGVGIEVTRIDLSAALPSSAKAAFDQVLVAIQDADRRVAEARTDAESWRQTADQQRDKIAAGARATAEESLARARSRTAEIAALTTAPADAPLLARIYLERIGPILAKAHRVDTFAAVDAGRLILPGAGR